MLEKLQSKITLVTKRLSHTAKTVEKKLHISSKWAMLMWLPLGVALAFAFSNLLMVAILTVLAWFGLSVTDYFRPSVFQAIFSTIIYLVTIVLVLLVPIWLFGKKKLELAVLGLQRLPSWTDIGLAPVTFIIYAFVTGIVLSLFTLLFPGLPLDQAQDVGFKAFGSRTDNILAFLTLVVVAPLAEETLFRGYLYGKLKSYVPAIWAALSTSLLFAAAHLQLNVALDVFVLSLLLCGLRSLTGSIWSGVLVHMLKNGVAYFILFVQPAIGG